METKSLDHSVLESIFAGDAAGVADFLKELSPAVDRIEARVVEACEQHDWSGARQALHEMKGMCASAGCNEVARLCAEAEADLAARRHDPVPVAVEALQAACERLRAAIREATAIPAT
jgi:HPt (histidine-containing phosphotransfer) domain-containing protein